MTDLALFSEIQLGNLLPMLQQSTTTPINNGASPTDPCLWSGTCSMPTHGLSNTGSGSSNGGLLPPAIVLVVQMASSVWKLLVLSLVGFPIQLLLWVFSVLDIAWGQLFRVLLGSFCKPCAWIAIWVFKGATFPILLFGWMFRIFTGVVGFMVDGWMLFFGGSGCFLRWGHDCSVKRMKERRYWEIGHLPFWLRDPTVLLPNLP